MSATMETIRDPTSRGVRNLDTVIICVPAGT